MKEPDPKPVRLGRFQVLVLEAVVLLRGDAYGPEIQRYLEGKGRKTQISTLRKALEALERAQVLRSDWTEPLPVQGGRSRRVYALTILGEQVVKERRERKDRDDVKKHPEGTDGRSG